MSRDVLFRIARRNTSFEQEDLEEVIKTEFSNRQGDSDLELSVYAIALGEEVRAYSEHFANARLVPPPRTIKHNRVEGLSPATPVDDPLEGPFAFLNCVHKVLIFENTDSLRTFVTTLLAQLPARTLEVRKNEAVAYIRERWREGDPEWIEFVEGTPNPGRWRSFVEG